METGTLNSKLVVIRGYLEKNLPHCVIQESARPETDFQLTVTYGEMGLCTLRVHAALLSDPQLNAVELRWALKERDIAGQVRSNPRVLLNHETLRMGDTAAIARRPRNPRTAAH